MSEFDRRWDNSRKKRVVELRPRTPTPPRGSNGRKEFSESSHIRSRTPPSPRYSDEGNKYHRENGTYDRNKRSGRGNDDFFRDTGRQRSEIDDRRRRNRDDGYGRRYRDERRNREEYRDRGDYDERDTRKRDDNRGVSNNRRNHSPRRNDDHFRSKDSRRGRDRDEDYGFQRYYRNPRPTYREKEYEPRRPMSKYDYHPSQSPKTSMNFETYEYRRNKRGRDFGNYEPRERNRPASSTSIEEPTCMRGRSDQKDDGSQSNTTVSSPREIQKAKMNVFQRKEVDEPDYNEKYFKVDGNRWISKKESEARKKLFTSTISILERYKVEKRVIVDNLPFINEKYRKIYDENPHLHEIFINREQFFRTHRNMAIKDRVIDFVHSPRTPYRRRGRVCHTISHWGQRKLLLSEIEFLSRFYDPSHDRINVVIYAGAAPGKHIPFLLELFPKIRLILVDPAKFNINESERIEIRNGFFTDEMADELRRKYVDVEDVEQKQEQEQKQKKNNVLFISDVRGAVERTSNFRTLETREEASRKVDNQVKDDMGMQHRWFDLLHPNAAMFKFRLSYYPGKTQYLIGDVYFPVFTGKSSSEARMMVYGAPTRVYDHEIYENIMFHFHSVTRTSYFEHGIVDGEGLDHCYDCAAEIYILTEYFTRIRGVDPDEEGGDVLRKKVVDFSKRISRGISDIRTLSTECFKNYQKFFDEIL